MMKRRTMMGGLGASAVLASQWMPAARGATPEGRQPFPPGNRLVFSIYRNGSPIGTHQVLFSRDGATSVVQSDVSIKVAIGPLVLFRFRFHGTERWQDGRFVGLEAVTDKNDHVVHVTASRQGEMLLIQSDKVDSYLAPAGTLPLTHWNRDNMSVPLFSPQTGKMMRETIRDEGPSPLPTPAGTSSEVGTRYVLQGDFESENWYQDDNWIGLRS
jgi:hypothetical protein